MKILPETWKKKGFFYRFIFFFCFLFGHCGVKLTFEKPPMKKCSSSWCCSDTLSSHLNKVLILLCYAEGNNPNFFPPQPCAKFKQWFVNQSACMKNKKKSHLAFYTALDLLGMKCIENKTIFVCAFPKTFNFNQFPTVLF